MIDESHENVITKLFNSKRIWINALMKYGSQYKFWSKNSLKIYKYWEKENWNFRNENLRQIKISVEISFKRIELMTQYQGLKTR